MRRFEGYELISLHADNELGIANPRQQRCARQKRPEQALSCPAAFEAPPSTPWHANTGSYCALHMLQLQALSGLMH